MRPIADRAGPFATLHQGSPAGTRLAGNLFEEAYTVHGRLTVAIHSIASDWTFSVQDTGIGILPEEQESIFGELYRVEKTAGARGLDLGLSIVRKLVKLLQGRLTLESEPQRGSQFTVTLPRRYQEQSGPPTA